MLKIFIFPVMLAMFGWQPALSDEDGQWLCEGTASSTTYHDGTHVSNDAPPSFVLEHTEDHIVIKYPSVSFEFEKEDFHNPAFFAGFRVQSGSFISLWKNCRYISDCKSAETMTFVRSLHMNNPAEIRDPRASTTTGVCRKLVD